MSFTQHSKKAIYHPLSNPCSGVLSLPKARSRSLPGNRHPRLPIRTPAILEQVSPVPAEAPEGQDLMERLIRIIMDATGFERDEIEPDMDLRKDLSIRSSRLPIIMDAAERQFGITIELEDFINVRTVKDIAQRISKIIARQGDTSLQPATKAVDPAPERDEVLKSSEDEASVKRLVFNRAT